jgi:hypothetical protein
MPLKKQEKLEKIKIEKNDSDEDKVAKEKEEEQEIMEGGEIMSLTDDEDSFESGSSEESVGEME